MVTVIGTVTFIEMVAIIKIVTVTETLRKGQQN
jgi:hypothetical protein